MIKKTILLFGIAILFNGLAFLFDRIYSLFVESLNPFLGLLALLAVVIPLAVMGLRRLARYFGEKWRWDPVILCVQGIFIFFIADLVNLVFYKGGTIDIQLHDTYYVIASTHALVFLVLLLLSFAALYYWYPRATGRAINRPMGLIHVGITLITLYMIAWPTYGGSLAIMGIGRRYIDFRHWTTLDLYLSVMSIKSYAALLLMAAQLLLVVNLIFSAFWGRKDKPAGR